MKCGECAFGSKTSSAKQRWCVVENALVRATAACTCNEARVARLKEQLGPEWVVVYFEAKAKEVEGC